MFFNVLLRKHATWSRALWLEKGNHSLFWRTIPITVVISPQTTLRDFVLSLSRSPPD